MRSSLPWRRAELATGPHDNPALVSEPDRRPVLLLAVARALGTADLGLVGRLL